MLPQGQQPHVLRGHAGAQIRADDGSRRRADDDLGVIRREAGLDLEGAQNPGVVREANGPPAPEDKCGFDYFGSLPPARSSAIAQPNAIR